MNIDHIETKGGDEFQSTLFDALEYDGGNVALDKHQIPVCQLRSNNKVSDTLREGEKVRGIASEGCKSNHKDHEQYNNKYKKLEDRHSKAAQSPRRKPTQEIRESLSEDVVSKPAAFPSQELNHFDETFYFIGLVSSFDCEGQYSAAAALQNLE